jgi:uncharacterized protein
MRKQFIAAVFTLLVAAPLAAATKEEKARKPLDVMNAGAMGVQMVDQMLGSMKQNLPTASPEFFDGFRKQVNAAEFVDLLVPIYAKHLSEEEMDALTAFFSSPVGKSFLAKQPAIMTDSMAAGSAWGEKIAAKVVEELMKKQ